MYCSNCGNKNNLEDIFCSNCGTNIKKIVEQQPTPIQSTETVVNLMPVNNSIQNNNAEKPNKNKKILLIIFGVLVVVISGVSLFFILNKKDNNKPNDNQTSNIKEEEKILTNTFEKLKQDYENGEIDVDKYFTELVNYEYDYDSLDEAYKNDEIMYTSGNISYIAEFLENHQSEISDEVKRKLLEKALLTDVTLGNKSVVEQQSNNKNDARIVLLDEEKEPDRVGKHVLDKVYLTKDEHFLIWYTDHGIDKVTLEQVQDVADELENSINSYKEIFNTEYLYKPYYDELINKNYLNARELLKKNGINAAKIDTAMNIYIYDTGVDGILATYYNPIDAGILIELILLLDIDDLFNGESGLVAYPYIVLNKRGISKSIENLKTVTNHELFHHFQFLYCEETSQQRCQNGIYNEAIANLASALVSKITFSNSFLNDWAGVYKENAYLKIDEINNNGNYGYGVFPYFYAYSQIVDNWASILMEAHNKKEPFDYIRNNTSKEDLVKVSERITSWLLNNDFDNKSVYTNTNIVLKNYIEVPIVMDQTIKAGAIDCYRVLGEKFTVTVLSDNSEYVGLKFYGYKDGVYTELASSMDKIEVDLTYYARYDDFYFVVYNADISNSNTYDIEVKGSEFVENSEFITSFNNYNIEIKMDIKTSGITSSMVSTGVMDERHQKQYLDITTTTMGISLNNKMYHDFNTGYSYMTQPYGGDVWWKDKSASQTIDLKVILNKLISMKNVTKLDDNHYKVKMSKKDVTGLVASSNVNASTISGDIFVEVYTENGYITKLEYDFSKSIKGVEKFITIIKVSNYDNAGDVEIPQSIVDNAKIQ